MQHKVCKGDLVMFHAGFSNYLKKYKVDQRSYIPGTVIDVDGDYITIASCVGEFTAYDRFVKVLCHGYAC